MINRIVITGHGGYASGIKSTIELIAGSSDEVAYIDFPAGDSSSVLMEKMCHQVEKNPDDQFLFMCDLLGGTPFKMAVELSLNNSGIEVVAGCNMGAMIETILQKNGMALHELADHCVGATQKSVVRFVPQSVINSPESDDGI